ncbi:glutaredoxin-C1-like [Rutidosis leptorrhynchoides]|uniref:glutaredoxin-C1-like n=1 Tax=Rutidosis leptorrhynchoides TaxID=125765 RepID=UPI003A9A3C2B
MVAKLQTGIRSNNKMSIMDQTDSSQSNHHMINICSIDNMNPYEVVSQLVSGNAVVIFSVSSCCMCTVAKRLLFGLGVGPTIVELDHHPAGSEIKDILFQLILPAAVATTTNHLVQPVPAVFVGGKFLGGIETLMACHINGTLVPLLKEAGALWL